MQIDWFTLVAQVINFLILLWLLQRFLYGPILATMQARDEKLVADFEAAAERQRAADEERAAAQAARQELVDRRDELLQAARAEAAERRKQMIHTAREETDTLVDRWQDSIAREKNAFLSEIQTRMGRQVVDTVRRALGDLANYELERAIVQEFVRRVERESGEEAASESTLGHAGKDARSNAVRAPGIVVRSTFELPAELADEVRTALRPWLGRRSNGDAAALRFEQSTELVCGIETEINDRRVGWNIRDYLAQVEQELNAAIAQNGMTSGSRKRRAYIDESADELLPG